MNEKKLDQLNQKFTKYFDGKEATREEAMKVSREIRKRSTAIIRTLHKHYQEKIDFKALSSELDAISKIYQKLKSKLEKYPELYYSKFVENDIQEYVEAVILLILLKNDMNISKLPDPDKLGIRYTTYLLGLADVIGELRRAAIDALLHQDIPRARINLATMEQLYELIIELNYTDGVLPLRRKQDIARAIIEKTRSELVNAVGEDNLSKNITELKAELNSYYKNVVRKN